VRPTTDRVRESVFGMLESLGVVDGAEVLDLFAGTGAMGIEALSRGAARATFVERDATSLRCIEANLAATGLGPAEVVRGDALEYLRRAPSFDLVFADPPYAFDAWDVLLSRLTAALVVAEAAGPVEPGRGWDVMRSRRYGTTVMTLLRPVSGTDPSER